MLSKNIQRAAKQCVRFSSTENNSTVDPEINVYSAGTSMRSQIVRLTLAELDLKHSKVPLDTKEKMNHHEEWYAKINPKMTVPSLTYNNETFTGSHYIMSMLNQKHPEKQLIPDDAHNRAKVEKYVTDVYSNFGAISAFTHKIHNKQRFYSLYEQTHPSNMKLER